MSRSQLLGDPASAPGDQRGAPARVARHEDGVRLWSGVALADERGAEPAPRTHLRRIWQRSSPRTLRAAKRLAIRDICQRPEGLRLTGKHSYDGFLVASGADGARRCRG